MAIMRAGTARRGERPDDLLRGLRLNEMEASLAFQMNWLTSGKRMQGQESRFGRPTTIVKTD